MTTNTKTKTKTTRDEQPGLKPTETARKSRKTIVLEDLEHVVGGAGDLPERTSWQNGVG